MALIGISVSATEQACIFSPAAKQQKQGRINQWRRPFAEQSWEQMQRLQHSFFWHSFWLLKKRDIKPCGNEQTWKAQVLRRWASSFSIHASSLRSNLYNKGQGLAAAAGGDICCRWRQHFVFFGSMLCPAAACSRNVVTCFRFFFSRWQHVKVLVATNASWWQHSYKRCKNIYYYWLT